MPKSKTVSSPSLKQSTLSFSASKRTGSNNTSHKGSKRAPKPSVVEIVDSDSEIEVDDDEIEVSSDDEDEVEIIESDGPAEKDTRSKAPAVKEPSIIKVTRPREKSGPNEVLELKEKDAKWRQHLRNVRKKRRLQLIHGEDQDKFHEILRDFDLSYQYGPCIGVTRLQRWERASALGLNPPTEVRDILTTREGSKDPSYSQNVFYDQV
ncbi:DNA polymerase delta, subunit 4-domain-containing protein [Mycena maculata]|uniref:DNA polymerase delta, subunit 4-domain-containing protein n=1 Tax=Mycena maculata TaxID=230809 RepID=A0AAD7NZB6_9AGAR|nr:DNA polymerase delta, subunit 4-domain-containing protein [Mycena maculata]